MVVSTEVEFLLTIIRDRRASEFINLKESFFSDSLALKLFRDTKAFYLNYNEFPSEAYIKAKFSLTFDLIQNPFGFLKDELQKNYFREVINNLIVDLSACVNENPIKAFNLLKSYLLNLESNDIKLLNEVSTLDKLATEILTEIRERKSSIPITGIPTGWQTLDKITQGYQKGDVYIFVARVKMGKSACLLYTSDSANKAGYVPLVISMEMKIKQFAKRHLALRSQIGYEFFKVGRLSRIAEREVEKTIAEMKKYPPFYYVEGQLKKDITELNSLINFYKPDLVCIDGGYLLDIEHGSKRQRWEEMEMIMKAVKSMAMRADIPIILTFQFKRDMLRKKQTEVGFEDIRLSDDIGAIASVVIGIFEKSPYEADTVEDVVSAKRYLEVIGGREGETGGFYINWDWERMNFSELTSEDVYDGELIKANIPSYLIESNLFDED